MSLRNGDRTSFLDRVGEEGRILKGGPAVHVCGGAMTSLYTQPAVLTYLVTQIRYPLSHPSSAADYSCSGKSYIEEVKEEYLPVAWKPGERMTYLMDEEEHK